MNVKSPVITGSATGSGPAATKQGRDVPTAVLIGVTGGLGQALARLLAAEGFRLVLAARREHDAAALTGQNDGSAIYQSADVTDPASLEKLASAAFGHLGRIDAVVNLAGLSPRKAIEEYTSADVDDMLAVNVKGPISVTQAFLPGLRKQAGGGVVVHLGGCHGWPRGAAVHERLRGDPRRAGELRTRRQPRACRDQRGAFLLRACAIQHRVGVPFFDMWSKMGVALTEPDVVAREILATIRQRRQANIMGGGMLKMLTIANAVSPSIADAIGLRKFGKLIQQYRPH